jgi:hypothetical protein
MTREPTQLGTLPPASLTFFEQKQKSFDIPFTAQLVSRPPLAGHEKADSALRYGAPNSRRVLPAFAS